MGIEWGSQSLYNQQNQRDVTNPKSETQPPGYYEESSELKVSEKILHTTNPTNFLLRKQLGLELISLRSKSLPELPSSKFSAKLRMTSTKIICPGLVANTIFCEGLNENWNVRHHKIFCNKWHENKCQKMPNPQLKSIECIWRTFCSPQSLQRFCWLIPTCHHCAFLA